MTTARLLDHWSPPEGAGLAVACLATSFTFDGDFFTEDCLSRFLSLSSVRSEGDGYASIATVLEEEERLSETQVTVLVDRSVSSEKRNLRWDLLPVAVPSGVLHAKVAVLLWERAARVLQASANLTPAGYRRQVEIVVALDLKEGCSLPQAVFVDLDRQLRELVALAPGAESIGPKDRAVGTINALAERVASLGLPSASRADVRLAIAAAQPGKRALDQFTNVWRGPQPAWATVLSPFWDDDHSGQAVDAVRRLLTARGVDRDLTLVVDVEQATGVVRAPASLLRAGRVPTTVRAFVPPDDGEVRPLHAKCVLLESSEWIAAMVGSSNATAPGLGLFSNGGNYELNLWIGCSAGSTEAKQLRALVSMGEEVTLDGSLWEAPVNDDEHLGPVLPLGFQVCLVEPGATAIAHLSFDPARMPALWAIEDPAGHHVLDSAVWFAAGSPSDMDCPLPANELPAFLVVRWDDGGTAEATWTANVVDRAQLPPPDELRNLPVDVLLAALASSRPLPAALEAEVRRRDGSGATSRRDELDPLRRFDDQGLLLHRARHLSLALHGLKQRLERPAHTMETIGWRLHGIVGPVAIADGLVIQANDGSTIPGEAQFLLAELALTVAGVDWDLAAGGLDRKVLRKKVRAVIDELGKRLEMLGEVGDPALARYTHDALIKARS